MSKPRIYIDTSCFIDIVSHKVGVALEEGRDNEVEILKLLLKAAENGDIEIYTCALTIAEVRYPKGGNLTDDIKRIIRSVLSSGAVVTLVEPTIFISESARDLKWDHNISKLGGSDAIHIATAIERKCDEFLTVEEKVLKQKDKLQELGLKVIKPSETLALPVEYRQEDLLSDKEEAS